jgi:hypothetical protein
MSKRPTAGHAESNACGDTSGAVRRSAQEPAEGDAIHRATSVGILSVGNPTQYKRGFDILLSVKVTDQSFAFAFEPAANSGRFWAWSALCVGSVPPGFGRAVFLRRLQRPETVGP